MNHSRQQSAHKTNSAQKRSSSSNGAGGQHATGAGQLQRGRSPSPGQPKRPPSSKFSASSLASSLLTALTGPSNTATSIPKGVERSSSSDSACGAVVPTSGLGTFSQAAAASASSSRSTSGALKPSSTSLSPANSGAGSLSRQPSEATTSSAGANTVRGGSSSSTAFQSASPLTSSRDVTEGPGKLDMRWVIAVIIHFAPTGVAVELLHLTEGMPTAW